MTTTRTNDKNTASNGSLDLIGQMVDSGLSNTFEALKDKVTAGIKDNGEQYLTDAVDKLKDSASRLSDWAKKNPVKTAVAVAAVLAVTAFLVSTAKGQETVKSVAGGARKVAAKVKPSAGRSSKKAVARA